MGKKRREEVRGAEEGMIDCWRITREILDSAYSWDTDGNEKTEEFGIGDKME